MVSDIRRYCRLGNKSQVLILVIMEYGLGLAAGNHYMNPFSVLILVIMEYGLGH